MRSMKPMESRSHRTEGDRRRARLDRQDFHCVAPDVLDMETADEFGRLLLSVE